MARLRQGADFMTESGNDLKRLADAAQPLYNALDDSQKWRLTSMMRHSMMGGLQGRMGERMHGRSMGRFSEWRGRHHWRDRDGSDGPRRHWRDRRDRQDGNDDFDDIYEGERL
jgi:hypothetical protein